MNDAVVTLLGGTVTGRGEAGEEARRKRAARPEPNRLEAAAPQEGERSGERGGEQQPRDRDIPEERGAQRRGEHPAVEERSAAHHRSLDEEPRKAGGEEQGEPARD